MEQNPFDQFDAPASTSAANPFDQFDEVKESSVTRRALGDTGVSLLKGAIAVPEAAVGIADIATGGRAGKVAEGLGFRPKEAKEILNEYYSPEQKAANQKLSEAEGFVDNVKTAVQNPSTILQAGVESVPLIAGGGVVGLGARALKATPVIAGAIGEGAVGAGMAAEGIRQETDDGLLSAKQSGIAALSGLGTAAFGAAGGKLAQKLGIGDIDTIASGGASPATNKGFARKLVEGGIAEGVFEELPQSVQEQMLSNYALDKPLTEGVDKAAAMGLLTGSAMGAGVGALTGGKDKLVIDQSGLEADAALAEQKQAEYDAQQPAQPEPDEFTNFTQQVDADIEQRKIAAGIKKPTEAIPASDILGDENVSNQNDAITEMVTGAAQASSDNAQRGVADLSIQPNVSGLGDVAATPTSSEQGNVVTGTGSAANDTLNRPFAQAADDFLPKMRSMTTDAKVIGQIDEELKLRGITNVDSVNTPAERVDETVKGVHVGEKINKEWTAFSPESGTLNIPRSEMPQVKAEHRGAMVNFLNARGVDHTQETVPASSLKPTQQEFSEAKVKKASKYAGGDRSILVSSDNHVLDGHHQWLSKLNKGGDVDVIRLNAPIAQLLDDVKEFPSSTVESGATTSKVQKPKSPKQYKPKTLLATLRDLGGIALTEKQDVTGEVKGFAPGGYNQVFKQASNRSLKGLIESGDLDDYLPYNMRLESNGANDDAFDSTEAYDYLSDKIRNGESVLPYAVVEELQALAYQGDAAADVANELTEDEINEQLRIATDEERESATNARVFNTDSENSSAESRTGRESAAETNASQQAEVTDSNTDLLGDNTTAKQAIADAEREKDTKRNSGNDNQDTFTLTGSNSEADQAAAAGAQDLFAAPIKQQSNTEASTAADVAENKANQSSNGQANDEVAKAAEALTAAGVKGKEKLDTIKDVREGKVTADEVADAYAEQPAKEDKPQTPLSLYDNAMDEYGQGAANVDDYKSAFNYVLNNEKAITEYLEANFTKQQLFKRARGSLESRYKSEKKDRVVRALYGDMVTDFLLPSESGMTSFSHGFGGDRYKDVIKQVEAITQESLDKAMDKQKQSIEKRAKAIEARNVGMQDPKTLDDYVALLRSKMADGMPLQEARMSLTQEQRETYDLLSAETTMAARADRKETQQDTVRTAGQTVEGNIIETKHTKKGHDLFVVQLAERVSKEDYDTLNTGAKKLGGYYSSFKGQGAVVGFQFTSRENAEAFVQLAGGDSTSAKEQVKERRDAYEDDKSQTAVERLTEMADRLEDSANEDLSRDRKTNTSRRAGMAARAEAVASAQKAMAITMRNIANSIDTGKAKFLGKVRQKVQVELLQTIVANAQYKKLREQYSSYSEYEKHQHEPADKLTADYADFPHYTLNRSDWARLGRAMVDVDGFKALGTKILSVADDVTAEYLKFAKDNLTKVAMYRSQSGALSSFGTKKEAEYAISRSGFNGQAIALQVKRGEYLIIDSPQLAKERGNWVGDDDKRISLSADFINQVIEKVGKANRKSSKIALPWQLESAYDRRNKLKRIGIETPAELRAAIREFVQIKENVEPPSKVKELERKMVGRKSDGLDFFPTPASTSDEMIETADIREGMTVLEPSAGMGHIAERIRDAGFEPDVVEFSGDRRELLELKGFNVVGSDFLDITEKYDRILMNPPFSNRRDEEHVRHAYNLLKPNGKLVAIMGEGVFFGNDKRATEFRDWLESVGGTSEKLEEGTFKDASLPVNTGVNARMVVIEKQDAENGADSDNVPMFSRANQPTFYSALTRAIEEIKTNKADPMLWKGMIKNLAQKGVKPDEVEWTGVNEWLDLQTSAVTKEQLLDYLNANGVQVSETLLGGSKDFTYSEALAYLADLDLSSPEEIIESYGYSNNDDYIALAKKQYSELSPDQSITKYSKYTVPGGENYRELLLTLPVDRASIKKRYDRFIDLEAIQQSDGLNGDELSEYLKLSFEFSGDAKDRARLERGDVKYKSSHFDQANILAHVRFDERTDADGNKVLFINEIQSDYGQDGKKRGFKLTDAEISSMKGYSLAVKIEELNRDWRGDRTSKAEQDKGWAEVEAEKQSKGITDADIKAAKEAIDRNVVALPRAPFVTKTDAWVSLAMKRMVRYAAENGFDKVALISGEQAADLYDLSKQINMASAIANNDGTYSLILEDKSGNEISGYDRSGKKLNPQELEDTIGKDLAAKLIDGANRNKGKPWPKSASYNPAFFTLRGLDLKVGGDGMRTFYNSIVPKVAKDVLKKVGGQVESINMQTVSDEEFETALDKAADNGEMITVGSDAYNALRYKQQVGFTITPEMREKVMGGLPLFNREANLAKGLPKEAIQRAVNVLRRNWKNAPEIIVVQDMSDPAIREAVREENDRQLSQGAEGQPEGFFDAGKVYIVASEMNSPDDLIRVVFHETLGHYGLRGLYGKELGGILDRVAMLRKRDMAKKAKQYGLDLTKKSDVRIIAEEVLAEMAQTSPEAGFVKRAIAAIRQFLRDIGVKLELTDNDIIANYLLPARNFVVNGKESSSVAGLVSAFVRNNREPSKENGDTFLTAALEFTARNEEFFDNAPSDSKDIAEIAKDIDAGYRVEPFGKSQTKLDGAENAWEVFMPDAKYRSAVIYEKGDEVWINVSRLKSGENQGNRIYSLAAAYAYNNDKVFIGDPLGLTAKAFYRRAESMLSTALKYGTTKHIEPHVAQTDPDLYYSFDEKTKDFGEAVRKINWKKGDDAHNIKELIYTVYHGAISNLPELKNVIFNPTTQGFTTIDGEQFTDDDFERVLSDYYARTAGDSGSRIVDGSSQVATVNTTETSNPYRAGIRTAKRTALFNTFLRKQSSEVRAELLGSYVRELQNRGLAPALRGVMYSRSNPQSSLTPQWDAPAESKLDNVVYALQDKNVDLKRVSQAIKKAGTDIADRWNAYLQEELYHGRTAKRTQDFIKNDLEPLIEDMRMRGVGMADFEEYLWARHAEERNIQIAKINPKMPDGGSGMSTQDARDYLANLSPSNKTKYEALARRIDLINRKSRQVLIDYGLESAATIASWESAYKNYVPLMREDMDAGFGNGTGQGFSVKGNSAKRATGSNRAVVDIIANMAQQYEKNVIRGEKNRVSTALIGLAKLNPNPDFWEVDTPPSTKTIVKGKTIYEVLYNGSKVNEFTNKPAANNFIQWNGSSGYTINEVESPEQVEYVTDPNYKNRDNVIVARIVNKLGKVEERSVVFNQFDERAMRMAASLKNLDQDQIGELLGAASSITRYFASVNTQYNPIFGLINITRDVQGALLNLSTTPIANKKKEVLGNTLDALKGIYQDLRSERKNGTPSGNKWSQLFEEFQNEGGQTGYRDMFRNAKERGEALKNALDPLWWQNSKIGKVISLNGTIANQEQWVFDKAIKPIFDWLSDYNNALENAVRLSVYKVALDNGHSKQQAASMAKNISVNFNRKGEMGRQIGSLYAFFNASVQGTARIGETLTSTDKNGKIKLSTIGKRIVQGGLLLGSMQALLLAAAGYDDDEPPEFVRDRSIIVPLDFFGADGKFVTVPMPLGYNAIPSFSRILTEWALSGGENTQERLVHILDMVMNVTNPIGNAGLSLQTIAPTVIDPLAALAENKDFTGRPIAREDFNSLNPTPGFTRAKDTASAISKGLAYGINAITGGTDYKPGEFSPSPDQIDYLIGQVTGGVGREAMKVEQTATALVTGEDLPAYKIPIVGRFYGDATGQSSQGNAFYKNLREINKHENQIKGMIKAGEDPTQYRLDNPESRLITQANYTERAVQKLRKQRRALLENGDDPSAIESIDDRITELMLNLNEKVKLRKEMQ